MDERLATDLLRAGTKLINPPTTSPRPQQDPTAPKFHKENAVVGIDLQDYTAREPSEDGKYVKVTIHKERIELIEQPPTAEEIEAQKEQRRLNVVVGAVVATGLLGLAGILQVLDRRAVRGRVEVKTDAR